MFRRLIAAGAAVVLTLGLLAAPARAGSPVAAQFSWLIDASARLPVPAGEVADHLAESLRTAIGGADGFNQALAPLAPFTPGAVVSASPSELRQVVSGPAGPLLATLDVDQAGLLTGLRFTPYLPAPASWRAVDSTLRTLAPRVSFAATRVAPAGCTLVHGTDPTTARPLGSAFKLYVLGAVAAAVRSGRFGWDTELALRPQWKSLPSGVLQDQPDGTVYTLAEYADYMIAISDNTATDHLIHRVGRDAVRRQFIGFGNTAPNDPVLSTREFFTLKGWRYPALASVYAALSPPLRTRMLPRLDRVPRSSITAWQQPRKIDSVEWFGSPMDICRAYAGLWALGDPQVNTALTANDGGIALSPADFPTVWFKGGSEPGVLTLTYLARAADGDLIVASLLLSDPRQPLDEATVVPRSLALLRGAIELTAAGR